MAELVLASGSPQRRAILEQLGLRFRVCVPEVQEVEHGDPRELVLENALRKARAATGDPVLAADTAVVLDGRAYGKPGDREEASHLLELLSGRPHQVLGGVVVRDREGRERTAVAATTVRFRELSGRERSWGTRSAVPRYSVRCSAAAASGLASRRPM